MAKKIPKNKQNSDYWKSRESEEKEWMNQNLSSDESFNKQLQVYFDKSQRDIKNEIGRELLRLSDKNGIDLAKVRQAVDSADIKELEQLAKETVQKAQNMRKKLGRGLTEKDFTKEVNDRMRLYNATMRINRLELIKSKLGYHALNLGLDVDNAIKEKLSDDFQEQYKRQAGIMKDDVPVITPTVMASGYKTIMATTGGVSFSKRIWADMDALKAELDVALVKNLTQGTNPRELATKLSKYVDTSVASKRYSAERIARTESARVQTDVALQQIKDNGYKFVKWHAEPGACALCEGLSLDNSLGYGKGVYKLDDVPRLPAHPNCRCAISATWVDDDLLSKETKTTSEIPSDLFDKSIYSNQISDNERVFAETWNKPKIKMKQRQAIDNEWYNNLSEVEKDSVKNYTTESYEPINMLSRDPHALDDSKRDEAIKRYIKAGDDLEKALSKAKYHENMVTYRNVGAKEFEFLKSQVGDEIHYTTEFKSTTTNQMRPIEKSYTGEQVVRYFIRKDSQAQYIADYSAYYEEQEVLINRKRPYTVKENNGNLEVYTW